MRKKILIISNRGFIGKAIYDKFIKLNNFDIYGLNSDNCDLLNLNNCRKILKDITSKKVYIVFLSTYGRFPKDDFDVYEKNITMINNFLKSINLENIEQLLFFSSTCIYGRPPPILPLKEDVQCKPNGYYGLSKFISEEILKLKINSPLSIIRMPGIYGKLDKNKSIINFLINKIKTNEKIDIYDGGLSLRDYVHVDDVVKFIKFAIQNKFNDTINIATGKSTSIINIVRLIEKKLNKKAKINFIDTSHTQFNMEFDIKKIINLFPSFNPIQLSDGIDLMISN